MYCWISSAINELWVIVLPETNTRAALRIAKQFGQRFGQFLWIVGRNQHACAGGVDQLTE